MTKRFRDALIDALAYTGWPIRLLAQKSGVSEEQLKKVKSGKSQSTNADDALKVARAFGLTLDEFLNDETAVLRTEAANLWRMLDPEEREILLAAARGLRARRHAEGQQSSSDS